LPDKFPEAFRRFEEVVDVRRIASFRQLELAFGSWAGQKWHGTYAQREALAVEARKHGIPIIIERRQFSYGGGTARVTTERKAPTWRHEVVTVKGHSQDRFRDLRTGRFIRKP
jgi:hypothetical protein